MKSKPSHVLVSENIGKVSLLTFMPKETKSIIVLAHGAGAGMTHAFMENLAVGLGELSIGTVRYNFPYMEKGPEGLMFRPLRRKQLVPFWQILRKFFLEYPYF